MPTASHIDAAPTKSASIFIFFELHGTWTVTVSLVLAKSSFFERNVLTNDTGSNIAIFSSQQSAAALFFLRRMPTEAEGQASERAPSHRWQWIGAGPSGIRPSASFEVLCFKRGGALGDWMELLRWSAQGLVSVMIGSRPLSDTCRLSAMCRQVSNVPISSVYQTWRCHLSYGAVGNLSPRRSSRAIDMPSAMPIWGVEQSGPRQELVRAGGRGSVSVIDR